MGAGRKKKMPNAHDWALKGASEVRAAFVGAYLRFVSSSPSALHQGRGTVEIHPPFALHEPPQHGDGNPRLNRQGVDRPRVGLDRFPQARTIGRSLLVAVILQVLL